MRNELIATEVNTVHPSGILLQASGIPEGLRQLLGANLLRLPIGEK
jgi:hypothetical protein